MDTTHAIVEVEREYSALLNDPRRSLGRFVEVSLAYARMVADPDPDRALEVFAMALETLHDPPAPAEAALALELIRSRREVARRLGFNSVEHDCIERERRMLDHGLIKVTEGLAIALGRRAAAVRFAEGEITAGFQELIGCLASLEHPHAGTDVGAHAGADAGEDVRTESLSTGSEVAWLGEIATDLVLAIWRHPVSPLVAEELELVAVVLRRDQPDDDWTAWCLVLLAALRLHADDTVTAQMYLRRAEGICGDRSPVAAKLLAGWVALAAGDHERALDRFGGAANSGIADERLRLLVAAGLGESLIGLGRTTEARAPLAEAIAYEVGDRPSLARCHELLAEIAASDGRFDEAYEHLLATRRLEEVDVAHGPHDDLRWGGQGSGSVESVLDLRADVVPDARPDAVVGAGELFDGRDSAVGQQAVVAPAAVSSALTPRRGRLRIPGAEAIVSDGLRNGWFELHVQSISSNEFGRPSSAEGLLRLNHPDRGLLAPGEFLAGFDPSSHETAGIGIELGEWVVTEACQTLRQWNDQGVGVALSINIAPEQLTPAFVDSVRRAIEEAGVPAHSLMLEVKEHVLSAALFNELTVLEDLRSLGVRLAVDNFGVRGGSLDLLVRFPVDVVKLDRQTIDLVTQAHAGSRETDALIALSGALGFEVVAEGVETAAQLDLQRVLGCHGAQGFLIGRPSPPAQFADLVAGLAMLDTIAGATATLVA